MGRFFAFLIYSFLFLCLGGSLISYYLDFSPFACFSWTSGEVFINPFSDWNTLYNSFMYGNWAVDSAEHLLIFFIFLFFFPLWILGWFLINRIHWKRIILKPFIYFKRHKVTNVKAPIIAKNSMGRPIAMRKMRGFAGASVMPISTNALQEENNTNTTTDSNSSQEIPSVITATQKESLRALGEKYGYDLFENVRLDNYNVPFVFATDTQALVTFVLLDNREWIADETPSEDGSEPTWFSAEGLISSPFYQMVEATKLLKEKEPDSEIIPVVAIAAGNVLNADAVKEQWKEKNGFVVLWDKGQGKDLSTLEELLKVKSQESLSTPFEQPADEIDGSINETANSSDKEELSSENL